MRLLVLALFMWFLNVPLASAQVWGADKKQALKLWVDSYDEFRYMFNFKLDPLGNPVYDSIHKMTLNDQISLTLTRKEALTLLFNQFYYQDDQPLCNAFVSEVINSRVMLSYYDRNWWMLHPAELSYKSKTTSGLFSMAVEGDSLNGSQWVIAGFDSPVMASHSPQRKESTLPPSANETSFSRLREALADEDHFLQYLPQSYRPDALTWLEREVRNGNIRHVQSLPGNTDSYHLLQIPGWLVVLKYFNRKEGNNGWLIAQVLRASEAEKAMYRKEVLLLAE